jgi:hypothetical protein
VHTGLAETSTRMILLASQYCGSNVKVEMSKMSYQCHTHYTVSSEAKKEGRNGIRGPSQENCWIQKRDSFASDRDAQRFCFETFGLS